MNWDQYFGMMADWKRLPAYKAEPRIDSLVGFFLPAMMTDFCHDPITGIVPELPLRLGTLKPAHEGTPHADKSYKVDFYLLGGSGRHYFVEFKTDSGSRNDQQDQYLNEARQQGMAAIVRGIVRIAAVSKYKKKYGHLLAKLRELGLLDESGQFSGKADAIEIIYVQPHRKPDDTGLVVDFAWMAQWLQNRPDAGEFETALARTLSQWSVD